MAWAKNWIKLCKNYYERSLKLVKKENQSDFYEYNWEPKVTHTFAKRSSLIDKIQITEYANANNITMTADKYCV